MKLSLRRAIRQHLGTSSDLLVDAALAAVWLADDGELDSEVKLPNGSTATALELIDRLRLERFLAAPPG